MAHIDHRSSTPRRFCVICAGVAANATKGIAETAAESGHQQRYLRVLGMAGLCQQAELHWAYPYPATSNCIAHMFEPVSDALLL
jgi:hypothetical protein